MHHDFVKGLANGKLPVEAFKHYLIQDYHYLVSTGLHIGVITTLISTGTLFSSQCLSCVQSDEYGRHYFGENLQ